MSGKIPVTVLTGFLGSGKTTLLNRILSENHGQRIAVIENEFGEIGVDQDLVINADEEIFEMNNGCICCTVRGDLIRILGNLMRRRDKFDRIILETTGMADPGPVAQTFFVDEEIGDAFMLDGIITLVDARHVLQHWDESDEVIAQIAFADRIILNKIDLVSDAELAAVENRIRRTNVVATILPVQMAAAPLEHVLNVGGFDLNRVLEMQPAFLEPEYPFEWGALYELPPGKCSYRLRAGPDASMSVVYEQIAEQGESTLAIAAEALFTCFSSDVKHVSHQQSLSPGKVHWSLNLEGRDEYEFTLTIPVAGTYALFTQHTPEELQAVLEDGSGQALMPKTAHYYNPGHSHDDSVTSVALEFPGSLDGAKFNTWLGMLLQTQGADIFRMKGIVSVKDEPVRYVFQGVHMLFDSQPGLLWRDEPRHNRLVFIGRNLDRDYLEGALKSCLC
jgi:G3E family GTPase